MGTRWRLGALPLLALAFTTVAFAVGERRGGSADSTAIAITGVRVIDGTGGAPREGMTVVVEGDRITAVAPDGGAAIPPDAERVDGRGKTVLPGLIDTHVHFRDYVPELFLAHGVTTVRDAGNPPEWILSLKQKEAAGEMRGPRIFAVGNILDAPPPLRGHHIAVATPDAARAAARDLLAKGVDGIKVYEKITPELLRPIVDEVHRANRRVIGHITFSARDAAMVGIDALEHASGIALAIASDPGRVAALEHHEGVFGWRFADPAKADSVARLLAERKVAVVPALTTWARGAAARKQFQAEAAQEIADPELVYLPNEAKSRVKNYAAARSAEEARAYEAEYRGLQDFLRRFHSAGGRIVVGTDGGVLLGLSVHHEMQLLVDSGLSPLQAIRAATSDAAALLGAADLGTIVPGRQADLIVVSGNPAAAIQASKNISVVIKRGRVIDTRYHRDYRIPIPRPPIEGSTH